MSFYIFCIAHLLDTHKWEAHTMWLCNVSHNSSVFVLSTHTLAFGTLLRPLLALCLFLPANFVHTILYSNKNCAFQFYYASIALSLSCILTSTDATDTTDATFITSTTITAITSVTNVTNHGLTSYYAKVVTAENFNKNNNACLCIAHCVYYCFLPYLTLL